MMVVAFGFALLPRHATFAPPRLVFGSAIGRYPTFLCSRSTARSLCPRSSPPMRALSSSNVPPPSSDGPSRGVNTEGWAADFWADVLREEDSGGRNERRNSPGGGGGAPREIVHFNNAGASPSPPPVLRAMASHLALEATVGGYLAEDEARDDIDGVYTAVARLINARGSDEIALVESATVGWTRAFYAMAEAVARTSRRRAEAEAEMETETSEDEDRPPLERFILVSDAEYAANVVAAVKFARDQNEIPGRVRWGVLAIPSQIRANEDGIAVSTGVVDIDALETMLSGRWELDRVDDHSNSSGSRFLDPECIAMICITHVPTNSGIVNPVEMAGRLIAKFNERSTERDSPQSLPGVLYVVDACQSAGQIGLDVQDMHCHALTATGRKYLRGPRGTGFLYVRREVANMLAPSHIDHSAAPVTGVPVFETHSAAVEARTLPRTVDLCGGPEKGGVQFSFRPGAGRFEFWESSISGRLGLGAAVRYALDTVGMEIIEPRCLSLSSELKTSLRRMNGVRIHHDSFHDRDDSTTRQCGIVTFSVEGMDSVVVKKLMLLPLSSQLGEIGATIFELSVVPATSTPVDTMVSSASSLVRASLTYFNTDDEIRSFCAKLQAVIENKHSLV